MNLRVLVNEEGMAPVLIAMKWNNSKKWTELWSQLRWGLVSVPSKSTFRLLYGSIPCPFRLHSTACSRKGNLKVQKNLLEGIRKVQGIWGFGIEGFIIQKYGGCPILLQQLGWMLSLPPTCCTIPAFIAICTNEQQSLLSLEFTDFFHLPSFLFLAQFVKHNPTFPLFPCHGQDLTFP